jgi:Trk K+ transport system NAD-binding subunit
LVAKRATRSWVNEDAAKALLLAHLPESELMETKMSSPAVIEKKLKKLKVDLPEGTVVAVSSGNTLADLDDPRPQVMPLGSLKAALSKLQG